MSSKKSINKVKIAISGKSGCGNTTVSRIIADTLNLKLINFTFRSLAHEKGISLNDILGYAVEDDSWDKEVDTRQVQMAKESDGCVLGSRLAIWMLADADLKVFLTASPETRARRIYSRENDSTLEAIEKFTASRDIQDHDRYLRIYDIDNDNYSFADLVIDTDNISPAEVAEMIISELKKKPDITQS